ncbi:hypothetical protein [Nostoc sp. 'Peltigera membranacea cyanobiont' 213]|uniref:hypothetical protein n=1 Tax=Nostoc sp. 'Peltigera membranacea cyanobiont' 213 TaxID=2014530 RepID=UPI00167D0B99|nr:hypothetical protein [Nostoc sp. 'Peltigera membranacea cyanobiont' 213]
MLLWITLEQHYCDRIRRASILHFIHELMLVCDVQSTRCSAGVVPKAGVVAKV